MRARSADAVGAIDPYLAGGLRFETGNDAQQRGFAAPRWTDQRDELPVGDREIDAFQNLGSVKSLAKSPNLDFGHFNPVSVGAGTGSS